MLSVSESAELLGVSTARVRALIKSGQLAAVKSGRAWILREEDVIQRLSQRPRSGRPKASSSEDKSPQQNVDVGSLHELYEESRKLLRHLPTSEMMAQAKSKEEASFYMAVADFFLQQRQAELVKSGVY